MWGGRSVVMGVLGVAAASVGQAQLPPGYEEAGGRERIALADKAPVLVEPEILRVVPPPREWLQFPAGQSATDVSGELTGSDVREFHVVMRRHQTMAVTVDGTGAPLKFSVHRRGRALFDGEAAAKHEWSAMLPATDDYVLRVALPDAAAQRGERVPFAVRVAVVGQR